MEADGVRGGQRWPESYHDITPFLCCYISEWHSFSMMSEAVQGGWSGGGGGVWGIGVLEVKILYSCQGVDISVGEPHIIRV